MFSALSSVFYPLQTAWRGLIVKKTFENAHYSALHALTGIAFYLILTSIDVFNVRDHRSRNLCGSKSKESSLLSVALFIVNVILGSVVL